MHGVWVGNHSEKRKMYHRGPTIGWDRLSKGTLRIIEPSFVIHVSYVSQRLAYYLCFSYAACGWLPAGQRFTCLSLPQCRWCSWFIFACSAGYFWFSGRFDFCLLYVLFACLISYSLPKPKHQISSRDAVHTTCLPHSIHSKKSNLAEPHQSRSFNISQKTWLTFRAGLFRSISNWRWMGNFFPFWLSGFWEVRKGSSGSVSWIECCE